MLFPNPIVQYELMLRKVEYYANTKSLGNIILRLWKYILYVFYRARFRNISQRLGFTIPINVCEEGLSIAHYGSIVISEKSRIGKNCRIHSCVNIGASTGQVGAPIIGNNVYIGPGAILFGDIIIADNVSIGANSTVTRSILKENVTVVGSPAKIIKENTKSWVEN